MASTSTAPSGSIDYRVTSLLTEHFGFPPLALIDDVINAVNDLLYKCTSAMETYLVEVRDKKIEESGSEISKEEIQVGTGKLETLLESQVDKNFDKFELYSLRNIFTLPQELVEEGWIRLKHHEGIDFEPETSKSELDAQIGSLVSKIKLELHLRRILKLQIAKAKKIIKTLRLYQNNLKFLSGESDVGELSPEAREAFKSLAPIDETLYFLLKQVEDLTKQTRRLYNKVGGKKGGSLNIRFVPDKRDRYIDGKSFRILEKLGLYSTAATVGDAKEEKNGEEAADTIKEIDNFKILHGEDSVEPEFTGNLSSFSDIDLVKDIGNVLDEPGRVEIERPVLEEVQETTTETVVEEVDVDANIDEIEEVDIDAHIEENAEIPVPEENIAEENDFIQDPEAGEPEDH